MREIYRFAYCLTSVRVVSMASHATVAASRDRSDLMRLLRGSRAASHGTAEALRDLALGCGGLCGAAGALHALARGCRSVVASEGLRGPCAGPRWPRAALRGVVGCLHGARATVGGLRGARAG